MKKKYLVIIAISIVIVLCSSLFFVLNPNTLSNVPVCIGYKINNKETFFDEENSILKTSQSFSVDKIDFVSYGAEDLKNYDHVVNTNEKFEVSFIIKNPKKDTILSITIDDSFDGKNKIYSSQSEKYHIKDITTEFNENKNTYYTYVTITITSCDVETERYLKIKNQSVKII